MSKYFDRLKQLETEKNSLYSHRPEVPKPPKAPFVSFVSTPRRANVKKYSNTFGISDHTAEPDKAEKLHELSLLIEYVAANNGFSDEDIIEAKSNAENDLENALLSFRELARAVRQVKVLELLEQNPDIQRAIYTDATSNEHYVTLAIAVFGYATCEVRVSKSRYDSFQLLDLVEKYGHQTH